MKKAKVYPDGLIAHVWPWTKTLPDGSQVIKQCPYEGRGKPLPDCIVDVPDDAKKGMMWDGKTLSVRMKKIPVTKPTHDILLEVLAEKLGMTWDELKALGEKRKNAVGAD
jgi:hypothetical protein